MGSSLAMFFILRIHQESSELFYVSRNLVCSHGTKLVREDYGIHFPPVAPS